MPTDALFIYETCVAPVTYRLERVEYAYRLERVEYAFRIALL